MPATVVANHLRVTPAMPEDEAVLAFSDANARYIAWTAVTYISARTHFDSDNAFVMDIHRENGAIIPDIVLHDKFNAPGFLGPEGDDRNARKGARAGLARTVTARLRAFGPDLSLAGYGCALPLQFVLPNIKTFGGTLAADNTSPEVILPIHFPTPSQALFWVGLSLFEPEETFNSKESVAIDIFRVDGEKTSVAASDEDPLGAQFEDSNVYTGVYATKEQEAIQDAEVRLRVMGASKIIVGGFVCGIYYPA